MPTGTRAAATSRSSSVVGHSFGCGERACHVRLSGLPDVGVAEQMTCIAGIVDGGRIYIGADSASAGGNGWGLDVRADEKVFRNGPCLMGFTTSWRMGQLLRYAFKPPKRKAGTSVHRYMVTTFVDAPRQCLKEGGFQKTKDEVVQGGDFLVGYAGYLFRICSDYQVGIPHDSFLATECAIDVALGSLHSTKGMKPRRRILRALEAAECFSAGVRRPFVIRSMAASED